MTPESLQFTGDAVTFLGLIGVVSTGIIIVTAFRRFFNSPMNFRMPVPEAVSYTHLTLPTTPYV